MSNKWVMPHGVNLRMAGQDDEHFLFSLFYSAHPELVLLPLSPIQLTQLMRQQFESQLRGYRSQYPQAEHWIIETQGVAVGKIMLAHLASAIHIIDFVVAEEWRGRGIGGAVLTALRTNVKENSHVLSLRVNRQNTNAKRLYQKLGFVASQFTDTHEFLVWP
jgi:RimJ/RimL family protein N-acetyltransferase